MALKGLIGVHIVCGVLAFVAMGVPLATQKGGRAHRRSGRVYVASMAGVVATALAICVLRLLEPTADHQGAFFLGLVGVLAGANTWYGVRVLKQKARQEPHRHRLDQGVAAVAVAVGGASTLFGLAEGHPLFVAFGVLTASLGVGQLREMAAPWRDKTAWLVSHLSNMLAACIATTTAFLVVNQPRLPTEVADLVPPLVLWLAPTAVGSPLIVWWSRRVRRSRVRAHHPTQG